LPQRPTWPLRRKDTKLTKVRLAKALGTLLLLFAAAYGPAFLTVVLLKLRPFEAVPVIIVISLAAAILLIGVVSWRAGGFAQFGFRFCHYRYIVTPIVFGVPIAWPALESIRFFDPSAFHREFFSHFGPKDFMGMPLQGAWWILIYYAVLIFVCNIGGEELWWRGYVLPRQELAFGRSAWIIHGICWSVFHLFMQPTLWDTTRMAITGLALSFVAQRTRSTWPGIVGHSFGNLTFFLSLVSGVTSH